MTKEEQIIYAQNLRVALNMMNAFSAETMESLDASVKALEQEPCEDCVSRQAVKELFQEACEMEMYDFLGIDDIPSVTPTQRWIPCSERLPKEFEFVNCTCHSLIDDRDDWVVETVYVPQPSDSPYSDWGNIPMLNEGNCEVVAWMHRDIPQPYKAESEDKE